MPTKNNGVIKDTLADSNANANANAIYMNTGGKPHVKTKSYGKGDKFWYDDLSVLYKKNRLADFVPVLSHTYEEKLNSIVRFGIYIGIILSILKSSINYLVIPIIAFGVTYFLYKNNSDIKSGFVSNETSEETLPTKENPFMNILIPEYVENPQRGPAASHDSVEIKKEVERYFNENLYRDVDDIWGKSNSQRQWYTNPVTTIPNDRDAFMEWCYDTKKVCKDGDLDVCNKYVDLRAGHV